MFVDVYDYVSAVYSARHPQSSDEEVAAATAVIDKVHDDLSNLRIMKNANCINKVSQILDITIPQPLQEMTPFFDRESRYRWVRTEEGDVLAATFKQLVRNRMISNETAVATLLLSKCSNDPDDIVDVYGRVFIRLLDYKIRHSTISKVVASGDQVLLYDPMIREWFITNATYLYGLKHFKTVIEIFHTDRPIPNYDDMFIHACIME